MSKNNYKRTTQSAIGSKTENVQKERRNLKRFYEEAHGQVGISMTNDYLFKALMQKDEDTLKNILAALLHMDKGEIVSVDVKNPIVPGEYIEEKDYILDIKVLLNDNMVVDLEMQVINEGNWPERSLCYLCRSFDDLNKGDDYGDVKPAIQIGIMDFTLFKNSPELYSTYMMINTKSGQVYTDKFRLQLLELKSIDLATDEDKKWGLDMWARFFKATKWEEIKMLAQESKEIEAAAEAVFRISAEEKIRQACEAREESNRIRRTIALQREKQERMLEEQKNKLAEQERAIMERERTIKEQGNKITEQGNKITEQGNKITEQGNKIKEQGNKIKEQGNKITEQGQWLREKDQKLKEKDQKLQEKDQKIQEQNQEIARLMALIKTSS